MKNILITSGKSHHLKNSHNGRKIAESINELEFELMHLPIATKMTENLNFEAQAIFYIIISEIRQSSFS